MERARGELLRLAQLKQGVLGGGVMLKRGLGLKTCIGEWRMW